MKDYLMGAALVLVYLLIVVVPWITKDLHHIALSLDILSGRK